MKQSEKLDLILKKLYEYRNDQTALTVQAVMESLGIYETKIEAERLKSRLEEDKLIDVDKYMGFVDTVKINSRGIEYCEETSFTDKNKSIVNMHFSGNFHNSNLMTAASSINYSSQSIGATDEITDLIQRIREALRQEAKQEEQEDLTEYIQDVENKIKNNEKVPRLQWNTLIQNSANLATSGSLILQLA